MVRVLLAVAVETVMLSAVLAVPAQAGVSAPEFAYRDAFTHLARGEVGSVKVRCPKGFQVAGGGAFVAGLDDGAGLLGSHPFDSDDRGGDPDDGWRAVGMNGSSEKRILEVKAVCVKGVILRYAETVVPAPPENRATATVGCASSEDVTGGGFALNKPSRRAWLVGQISVDDASDDDLTGDNAWSARVWNGSDTERRLRAWSVCTPAGFMQYIPDPGPIPASTATLLSTQCPDGTAVTSGGLMPQTDVTLVLGGTHPGPGVLGPPTSWTNYVYNPTASIQQVSVYALCMVE